MEVKFRVNRFNKIVGYNVKYEFNAIIEPYERIGKLLSLFPF